MNIQLNRVCLILAIVSAFLPFVHYFIVGDLPPVVGNTKGFLSLVGDFLSSQMIGIVVATILYSTSRMLES
ncbi:hypothetical protein [Psychromonas aquimarina]|uniref:hypothetical protein n=1 Tax=Psychromonas aquimarina TaxID=444919 RepID=UPI00048E63C5|nr:hypothetical protein [Psychromonas aquimarina]